MVDKPSVAQGRIPEFSHGSGDVNVLQLSMPDSGSNYRR